MESKISKILDHADKLSVIENQKEILLRQFEEDSIFYFNGQQITVTPTLIATVKSYVDLERQTITILDDFKNPIGVGNPEEFLMKISNRYQIAIGRYETEYKKLIKQRGNLDV